MLGRLIDIKTLGTWNYRKKYWRRVNFSKTLHTPD